MVSTDYPGPDPQFEAQATSSYETKAGSIE